MCVKDTRKHVLYLLALWVLDMDQISILDLLMTSHTSKATGTFKAAKQPQTVLRFTVSSSRPIRVFTNVLKTFCIHPHYSLHVLLSLQNDVVNPEYRTDSRHRDQRLFCRSKSTRMATVDHCPTSTSDLRAVFHLWATYVILNIAKGEGYTESRQLLCLLFFCLAFDVRTVAFENSRIQKGRKKRSRSREKQFGEHI